MPACVSHVSDGRFNDFIVFGRVLYKVGEESIVLFAEGTGLFGEGRMGGGDFSTITGQPPEHLSEPAQTLY